LGPSTSLSTLLAARRFFRYRVQVNLDA
jgi:hypothetical protein